MEFGKQAAYHKLHVGQDDVTLNELFRCLTILGDIYGMHTTMILDTGADISLVSKEFLSKLRTSCDYIMINNIHKLKRLLDKCKHCR